MEVDLPPFACEIIEKFNSKDYEIYIVGGAVRDVILGRPVTDWDFTTNATPEQILMLFPQGFYDNNFGTVGISHPSMKKPFEITTFRRESGYSDTRRPDKVEWGRSLEEDLQRRDFTINAMALRCAQGKPSCAQGKPPHKTSFDLIDPFAGGVDLKNKLIRSVGDPNMRFAEDGLRLLRAIRIGAELNFEIEKNTLDAICANASLIHKISGERVRDELLKTLSSPHPYEGILLLKNSGLLEEILPELAKGFGVEQKSPGRHHIHDVGTHSLLALKFCESPDPIVRLAVLIHDIGKPTTYKVLESGTITFYNHELVGARIAARIADRLRLSNEQKDKLVRMVRWHLFSVDEHQTDSAIRRFIRNVGVENIADMVALRTADRLGSGASITSWRLEEFKRRLIEVQKQPFSIRDLKIDGNDVMTELNIPPGPKVGEILEKLFDKVVNKKINNARESLLKELKCTTLP